MKIGTENDMPMLKFSDRVKGILARSIECSVVVKLLGRTIGYRVLYNRIMALWKPSREVSSLIWTMGISLSIWIIMRIMLMY